MEGKDFLILLLGWSLGCFSPWIAELIQRPYRRRQIQKSIFIEFRELRYKLACLVWLISDNSGKFDRATNVWVEEILLSDKSPYEKLDIEETISKLLKFGDEELKTLNATKPKWETLKLKKFNLSFLNSQISSLLLFSPEFQRLAHEILGRVATLNEEIDAARYFHEKTFDNISDTNRAK